MTDTDLSRVRDRLNEMVRHVDARWRMPMPTLTPAAQFEQEKQFTYRALNLILQLFRTRHSQP